MKRTITLILAVALMTMGVAGAQAAPSFDLTDPASLVSTIASDKVQTRSSDATLVVSQDRSLKGSVPSRGPDTSVQFDQSTIGVGITIRLDGNLKHLAPSGGYEVFTNAAKTFATYLQPTSVGGQAIFAVTGPADLGALRIALPVDEGAKLVPAPTGGVMVELKGNIVAILAEPWARDATGAELKTSYRLDGDEIVQKVVVTPTTTFPVLADPAWTYAFKYDIGVRTPASVKSTLHSCFNCKFPVTGAPAAFPVPNQLLPLSANGIGNFECRMGVETTVNEQTWVSYDFFFNATANHIDRVGSGISFSFQFFPGDSTYSLMVFAYVVNDFGGLVGQTAYTALAMVQWAIFANNLYISP